MKLVCQFDTHCTGLNWENLVYTKPNIEPIDDHFSFSKLEHQNYIRWGKLGINQLHSICTFRISNSFVTLTHLVLDWSGKIWFKVKKNVAVLAKYLAATFA